MVAIGGAAGSVLRYGAHRVAVNYAGADTVLGTLAVNLSGSFVLGFLATMLLGRLAVPDEVRNFLTFGLLGGFTTFSALSYQTVYLMDKGLVLPALAGLMGNVVLGLLMAYLGVALARTL